MDSEEGRITIKDVAHVMRLLVGNLYGHDPHLTIRELIQNAHDALVDLGDSVAEREKSIMIRLWTMEAEPYIEIQDNGSGLTGPEMRENFGKIGDSEKLSKAIEKPEIIGRFGIGFLSAFIVADRVEVLTKKFISPTVNREDCGPWLWKTMDQQKWTLRKLNREELSNWTGGETFDHGTRVRLHFRAYYQGTNFERINDLRTIDGIEKIIRSNCYLLPFPIRVAIREEPGRLANLVRAPWDSDDLASVAYEALFGKNPPFFTHRVNRREPSGRFHASGVLYFREHLNRTPSVQLYVKRMLVNSEDHQLIPPYGVFVSGIVDCPQLEVDLARRQVALFDPAYKWLRGAMLEEFEKAFLEMTRTRFEDFARFWPAIDNTFITYFMEAYASESDPALEIAAKSFLPKAGIKLPFYLVDVISGSQGRPLWQTIEEYATKRRRELSPHQIANRSASPDEPIDEHGRIRVWFTKSQQPVEKDLLIERYKELFDVGRAEKKSHEVIFSALQSMGLELADVTLVEVQASRFSPVGDGEMDSWTSMRNLLHRLLVFYGRSHEVAIENFEPRTTPIIITDPKVDSDQVKDMRKRLSEAGMTGGIMQSFMNLLEQLESKGGTLVVHVNARNDLMLRLRDALIDGQSSAKSAATEGLAMIAWRAVVDFFGWSSTRDMIARDRENAHQVIRNFLSASEELAQLQVGLEEEKEKTLASEQARVAVEVSLAAMQAANVGNERYCSAISGFVDLVNSTQDVMANPRVTHEESSLAMRLLVADLADRIAEFGGDVISFTGDGLLFLIPEERQERGFDIRARLVNLTGQLEVSATSHEVLRVLLDRAQTRPPRLRLGLSFGQVFVGRVGPSRNVVGLPIVEAARITSCKDLVEASPTSILMSGPAYEAGARWGMWKATDFEKAGEIEGKGLPRKIEVYRPKS